LQEHGVEPALLILEVTEGLLVERLEEIVARMNELAALGVRFSIDDFGTGYSSLAYLKRMPLYELKIDRSFIMDMPDDANDVVIVQTILAMAGQMGLRVVAEGVETQAQADFLAAHGCHALQGYLLGRPAPLPALLDLLTAQAALAAKAPVRLS
jgi:EAL domain-containing protein (putative c-di-GMP-specific phosphodiesterase class I)